MMRIAIAAALSVAACGAVSPGFVRVPTQPSLTDQRPLAAPLAKQGPVRLLRAV
jgi:hypothetical protein